MFVVNKTTRAELSIETSFFKTREEAVRDMWSAIFRWSEYCDKEAFEVDAERGRCGMDENSAWFDTEGGINEGTAMITIVEVPVLGKEK